MRLLPPNETNGRGTPVTGSTPTTAPMLIAACITTRVVETGGEHLLVEVPGTQRDAVAGDGEQRERREHRHHADEAELLPHRREDHIRVGFGEVERLLDAVAQPHPVQAARAEGDLGLDALEAGAVGIAPGVEEREAGAPGGTARA